MFMMTTFCMCRLYISASHLLIEIKENRLNYREEFITKEEKKIHCDADLVVVMVGRVVVVVVVVKGLLVVKGRLVVVEKGGSVYTGLI